MADGMQNYAGIVTAATSDVIAEFAAFAKASAAQHW
jgi:hypothetical protein